MTARNIGVVLVRLFCIYLVITVLQSLSYVVPSLIQFGSRSGVLELLASVSLWLIVTTILLPAACAYWLWHNADRVLPNEAVEEQPSAGASELMLVGVSLLGLYLLVWGVIDLVRVEAGMAGVDNIDAHAKFSQRIPYIAQIIIALPLLIGRRRLSELLRKAKYAGTEAN